MVLWWMLEMNTLLLLNPEYLGSNSLPSLTISLGWHTVAKASHPDFDTSVCITKFRSFCLGDFQFFNHKFSTDRISFFFDTLFNAISVWYEQAWFRGYIWRFCKYLSYRWAGRTVWIVEGIRPISFVISKALRVRKEIWHLKITFSLFSSVSPKIMVWLWVIYFMPKNSFCWNSFRTDFLRFIRKPRCSSRKIYVSAY